MKFFDANTINQKRIEADICIIGAGPAGVTLAFKLENLGLNVVIVESGGLKKNDRANNLNALDIKSNFTYRDDNIERNRQLGGTANLWAGRVVPFSFEEKLDEEWVGLKEKVIPYYNEAFRIFGIDPDIQKEHEQSVDGFYAYWADQTERFNYKSELLKRIKNVQLYYNLTCIGVSTFEDSKIQKMLFRNKKNEKIQIESKCFVFAMGTVENSRMLLVIREMLPNNQTERLQSVGKFMMDHPRIWHGDVTNALGQSRVSQYQIKRIRLGSYKTGIRNKPHFGRVYCNLMRKRGRLNNLIELIPSESFEYSFRKLLVREKGVLKATVNEFLKWPMVRESEKIERSLKSFFNDDVFQNFNLMTYCEQRPREENRITLKYEKDKNGLPIPKLENNIQENELQEVADFYDYLNGFFKNLNCQIDYNPSYLSNPLNYTDAAHPMGGTRYSSQRDRKVVEQDLSVVGIPNLYITGSSVFPTSSVENPTHLIVSLSCYMAEVLSKKYR